MTDQSQEKITINTDSFYYDESLTETYGLNRYVMLPGYANAETVHSLRQAVANVATRRVICGDKNIAWDEQNFSPGHAAYNFFRQEKAAGLIGALTSKKSIDSLVCWTSGYSVGEYINPHRDNSGTIQLLVCLEAPDPQTNGGVLTVANTAMPLAPGDAVAFEATQLEHFTTPLIATLDEPDPRRVVLVGRYFLSD